MPRSEMSSPSCCLCFCELQVSNRSAGPSVARLQLTSLRPRGLAYVPSDDAAMFSSIAVGSSMKETETNRNTDRQQRQRRPSGRFSMPASCRWKAQLRQPAQMPFAIDTPNCTPKRKRVSIRAVMIGILKIILFSPLGHQATCITSSSLIMRCDQMHRPNRSCTLALPTFRAFVTFPVSLRARFTDRPC